MKKVELKISKVSATFAYSSCGQYSSRINNTNIKIEDIESEKLSIEDKEKLVKIIDDAKAEVERLHIIDIINKVCD